MPKQNHIVRSFGGGLVLDIAREDLPPGFLVNNTRNVHVNRSGHLIGFRDRIAYLTSTGASSPVYAGKHYTPEGLRNFHIEDLLTPRLRSYDQGATVVNSKDFPSGVDLNAEKVSHAQRLAHLYIGTGNTVSNSPLWYGKHSHVQFGVNPPADYDLMEGRLASPTQLSQSNSFPTAIDAVQEDGRTYMISGDTPYVYKFNGQTLELRSLTSFNGLSAICADSELGHVWVFERQSQSLFRLDSNLEVVSSIFLSGLPNDGKVVYDIELVSGYIYMARRSPDGGYESMNNWLYRVGRTTSSINRTPTDISRTGFPNQSFLPYVAQENDLQNYFYIDAKIRLPKKCFVVASGILYVICNIAADFEMSYYNLQEDYSWTAYRREDKSLTLASEGEAANSDLTGNLVQMRIGFTEETTTANMNDIRMVVDGKEYHEIDSAGSDGTNLLMFNNNVNDSVQRVSRAWGSYTGNTHMVVSYDPVPFGAIKPVFGFGASPIAWFSENTPPKTGTISGLVLSNETQSQTTIDASPIPGGFSEEDRVYHYAFSLVYDGYMESPLSDSITASGPEESGFTIKMKIPQSNINRRVTGMNLYRAEGTVNGREEFYRLVDYISFEGTPETDTISGEAVYVFTYSDRKKLFELGVAYTSNSGIPETMQEILPHYGLSVAHEDMLFVADCWHPNIDNGELMMFRSQPYAFNVFNVENDVLRLDARPTAMASFGSRVCVCDSDQMIVVEPASMVIEERYQGMGAINSRCMVSTDFGLMAAGTDHIRLFDGQSVQNLTERITIHSGANLSVYSNSPGDNDWNGLRDYQYFAENASDIHMVYNPNDKTVAVYGVIAGDTIGYIFNFDLKNWSRFVKPAYSFKTSMALNNGELLVYKSASVDKLYGEHLSGNHLPYVAELSPFEADDENIDKWFYEIRLDYLGTAPTVKVSVDQQDYSPGLSESSTGVFKIPTGIHDQGNSLRILLEGSAKIRSLSVIYRPKIVRS